jgi:hypothetical protein
MTKEFEDWFKEHFSFKCFSDEEREELKVYCWMAWRDSRRAITR